jgi:hypothetical protein
MQNKLNVWELEYLIWGRIYVIITTCENDMFALNLHIYILHVLKVDKVFRNNIYLFIKAMKFHYI